MHIESATPDPEIVAYLQGRLAPAANAVLAAVLSGKNLTVQEVLNEVALADDIPIPAVDDSAWHVQKMEAGFVVQWLRDGQDGVSVPLYSFLIPTKTDYPFEYGSKNYRPEGADSGTIINYFAVAHVDPATFRAMTPGRIEVQRSTRR